MIEWFVRNPVAANLLMAALVFLGLHAAFNKLPLEVFPDLTTEVISVTTAYPGASPGEIEDSVTLRVEEAVADLPGIAKISSVSSENASLVQLEVTPGRDTTALLGEVKTRVDALSTLPGGAERPLVERVTLRRDVVSVVVQGEIPRPQLRTLAQQIRDELSAEPGITQVELSELQDFQVTIEVSREQLRRFDLTLDHVASAIRENSIKGSSGTLYTHGEKLLVETDARAEAYLDFLAIPLQSRDGRDVLYLRDVAKVVDGFDDNKRLTLFNGLPALEIEVFRTGSESSTSVADAVYRYVAAKQAVLPDTVQLFTWRDRSVVVEKRLKTLLNSAWQGGLLVFLILSLFLRPAIAFWVFAGIPVAFMGALMVLPYFGFTLNVVSLFGFILVLGIVVDDAIVTGENVYRHMQSGTSRLRAAIEGTREIAIPVTFGVLTTLAAFYPLTQIDGVRGELFAQIAIVVMLVLLFSLLESKLILPAHLSHVKPRARDGGTAQGLQASIAEGFERFAVRVYQPLLEKALRNPGLTLLGFACSLVIIWATVTSGWMKFTFFPRIESEVARASLSMPPGTPFELTEQHVLAMTRAAESLQADYIDPVTRQPVIKGIYSSVSETSGRVMVEVIPPEDRSLVFSMREFNQQWRKRMGALPGSESLSLRAEVGRSGDPIDIQLSAADLGTLKALIPQVKDGLRQYDGVFEISDSLSSGKQSLEIRLTEQGLDAGLSRQAIATQVRNALYGVEVARLQRGRDDVRVKVRLPELERDSYQDLIEMDIRLPDGTTGPLGQFARLVTEVAPGSLLRVDRMKVASVSADVNKESINMSLLKAQLAQDLHSLMTQYPGASYTFAGEAEEQKKSMQSLLSGIALALFAIYALLAIPFKSYLQPVLIMSVIPFAMAGAVLGHWILGLPLSFMSLLGMLALSGVVVNDSLVLVDYINQKRDEGIALLDAVRSAGVARFRAVILTSLTTFAGMAPLVFFETSTQAQFLIPMAVSLGFGILFATGLILILVPLGYYLLEKGMGKVKEKINNKTIDGKNTAS